MRFRLAFWMKDPAGAPGDVVEVPDSQVDALVKAGIGRPEDSTEQPGDGAADAADQESPAPPARTKRTTKADPAG